MTYLVMNRLLLPVLVPISPYKTTLKSEHADLSYKKLIDLCYANLDGIKNMHLD